MAEDELTHSEKVTLIANIDARQQDDYDEVFYELLMSQRTLGVLEVDDRIRRAITKFARNYSQHLINDIFEADVSLARVSEVSLTVGFLRGYELGRKLCRPLALKETEPK